MDASKPILNTDRFQGYVADFAADDREDVVNLIPNAHAWDWMRANVPLFECPDAELEKIYFYRWWTFRKHLKQTPQGTVITEFISHVSHAGAYNTISCALGFHLAEGRWIRQPSYLDDYTRFWFFGNEGKPQPHFHKYSSWIAPALLDRCNVTGRRDMAVELLDALVADYQTWEQEKSLPDSSYWQYDVRDGMEESISGSRTAKNVRPTINSYMYANAIAIAEIAGAAGKASIAAKFNDKASRLKAIVQKHLWDPAARFFKVQFEDGTLSTAREAIGFIPWCFNLPDPGYEDAWAQLIDSQGFWAPFGITTAERRHPQFRSHGVGHCEWDGAVWPFATSQTLDALANVLRNYPQIPVTRDHYLEAMQIYAKSHHWGNRPYIGEYLDETTGAWLKGDNPRSRYYNHSTFCDLVITGLVGLRPRPDQTIEIDPLLPPNAWDFFFLDAVPYHGHLLTILWDRTGQKYNRGAGLHLFADGQPIAHSPQLQRITATLPTKDRV